MCISVSAASRPIDVVVMGGVAVVEVWCGGGGVWRWLYNVAGMSVAGTSVAGGVAVLDDSRDTSSHSYYFYHPIYLQPSSTRITPECHTGQKAK